MLDLNRLCFECMEEKGEHRMCPHCGAIDRPVQMFPLLPLGSLVGGRYYVGKALNKNSEGVTYIAFDTKEYRRCTLREFFPEALAMRDPDTVSVYSQPGSEASYDDCREAFNEMWKKLMRLRGLSAMITVTDVFAAGNTSYAVYDEVSAKTLNDHLLGSQQEYMEWEQARILFMPVLSTLGTLHTSGVIHKGISPNAFIFTQDGKLKLTDFCIPQARLAYSELDADINEGYAPLECYAEDGSIGPWTDVYSFAAVLYRTLIGAKPIAAPVRAQNDKMMIPAIFAEKLPPYVINALISAMQINAADRTRNMEQLRANLSASPRAVSATAGIYGGMGALNLPAGELRKAPVTVAPAAVKTAQQQVNAGNPYASPRAPQNYTPDYAPEYAPGYAPAAQGPLPQDVRLVDDLTDDQGRPIPSYEKLSDAAALAVANQKKNSRQRKGMTVLLVILIAILLAGAALVINEVLANRNAGTENTGVSDVNTMNVPVLTGQQYENVVHDNYYSQFFTFIKKEQYTTSDDHKGEIVQQNPAPGVVAAKGTQIELTVDMGRASFTVPDLTGYTYENAVAVFAAQGLICIKASKYNDGTHAPDTVAETVPPAGTVMQTGGSIQIVLWSRSEPQQTDATQPSGEEVPTDENGNPVIRETP